jgi:hypothetical protein
VKEGRWNYQSRMRRESGVEDDGVLFINPSVSTPPSGDRGSDGNYLISCHLQMTPRTRRQNKIEKREKPNGERWDKQQTLQSIEEADRHAYSAGRWASHDAKLREIISAYNLADNKSVSSQSACTGHHIHHRYLFSRKG